MCHSKEESLRCSKCKVTIIHGADFHCDLIFCPDCYMDDGHVCWDRVITWVDEF